MENEFGYIFNKPFTNINVNEEKSAVLNIKDNYLEVKIKGYNGFNYLKKYSQNKLVEKDIYYAINSNGFPITLYNSSIIKNNFKAISDTIINSEMYIVGKQKTEPIKHFTENTKAREILYYHDELINIFGNATIKSKEKFDKKNRVTKVQYDAKRIKQVELCDMDLGNYSIKINLIQSFSFNINYNVYEFKIVPQTYLSLSVSKGIDINEIYKIRKRLDSVIHLMTFSKKRNKTLDIKCYNKLSYTLNDLSIVSSDKKSHWVLNFGNEKTDNFAKLFGTMIRINDNDSNSFFPFLNYDRVKTSLEIQFLEYYRVLEFMNILSQKKKNKQKDKKFLLPLIKKYSFLKQKFFPNDNEDKIEEEIRSLRNYYSHYGYYINQLPVPTDKPNYYKDIDYQWVFDVLNFIKTIAYLELYLYSDITVEEKTIINYIR